MTIVVTSNDNTRITNRYLCNVIYTLLSLNPPLPSFAFNSPRKKSQITPFILLILCLFHYIFAMQQQHNFSPHSPPTTNFWILITNTLDIHLLCIIITSFCSIHLFPSNDTFCKCEGICAFHLI